MNIVGKILVFLNLLFALAVGGFLIVDFATRTNWQQEYDRLKQEMDVARRNQETLGETTSSIANEVRKAKAELEAEKQKLIQAEQERKDLEMVLKADLAEAKRQQTEAQLNAQSALAEADRLKTEVGMQLNIIKQRDEVILKQQSEVVKYRNAAVAEENARKALQDRLEQALAQNADLSRSLTRVKAGATSDTVVKGQPNPPTVYVEGKVEHVHPQDSTLVQVSIGSDKGLTKNQTLEVYRMDPPAYLGLVRLTDVQPHHSFGRLERVGSVNRGPVRVGDIVASSLTRN